jgi:hypothetical protein
VLGLLAYDVVNLLGNGADRPEHYRVRKSNSCKFQQLQGSACLLLRVNIRESEYVACFFIIFYRVQATPI